MLKLSHQKNADHLDLFLDGALDSQTSLELQEYLNRNMGGIKVLTMHFEKLDYDTFDITGLLDVFTII